MDFRDDELIDVKLPRKDYEMLREMIKKQEAMSWLGRYLKNVGLVAAGGFLTLWALWDKISFLLMSGGK